MSMNTEYITWQCPHCEAHNVTENHSDPEAHFVSMVCDFCDEETDGCFCDYKVTVEFLNAFFEQKGINKAGVCQEADITQQYLNRILREVQPITHSFLSKLIPVISKYGF